MESKPNTGTPVQTLSSSLFCSVVVRRYPKNLSRNDIAGSPHPVLQPFDLYGLNWGITKISFIIGYFLLILLGSLACKPESHTGKSEAKAMRRAFCEEPFQYFYPQSPGTVNALANHYYGNRGLKAAVFADYNAKPYDAYFMVNFGWPFEKNLPPDILAKLKNRNLLNKKLVDVAWVVQPLSSMGGNSQVP